MQISTSMVEKVLHLCISQIVLVHMYLCVLGSKRAQIKDLHTAQSIKISSPLCNQLFWNEKWNFFDWRHRTYHCPMRLDEYRVIHEEWETLMISHGKKLDLWQTNTAMTRSADTKITNSSSKAHSNMPCTYENMSIPHSSWITVDKCNSCYECPMVGGWHFDKVQHNGPPRTRSSTDCL